jgi:hypothetical protein
MPPGLYRLKRSATSSARLTAHHPAALLILNAPSEWTWGMPSVVRPPFMDLEASQRVHVISNREAFAV